MAPRNPTPGGGAAAGDEAAGAGTTAGGRRKWKPSEITRDHLVIDGKVYDVAAFAAQHPGGRVILSMVGEDATDAFRAFHRGSERTYAMLPSLCVGEMATPMYEPDAFEKDCRDLSNAMLREGMYKANIPWYFTKFAINASIVIGSALLAWRVDSLAVRLLAALAMGLGFQQFGWMAHEWAHHQVFKNHDVNDAVLLVACIFLGFDRDWWSLKHNTHHALPNVLESSEDAHDGDPDIDTLPFLAWSHSMARKVLYGREGTPFARFCVAHQHIVYFPLLLLARLTWMFQSIALAFRIDTYWSATASTDGSRTGVVAEQTALRYEFAQKLVLVLHLAWYVALVTLGMPLTHGLAFVAVNQCFTGLCMALAFGVGHNGCPVYEAGKKPGFFRLQTLTTRNIVDTPLAAWFMGGLHYQMEHHLFPSMPHSNLSKVAPRVRALCERHGVPYRCTGFWEGTAEVLRHLHDVSLDLSGATTKAD